jgi:tRNA pseudouridine55 synthase
VDGILNVNKEKGISSFGVVACVREITGQKKAGHTGTLDPLATGLLTVCLGRATRVVQYLTAQRKTYLAIVELGTSTDTYDAEGQITASGDYSAVTEKDILAALETFKGTILQRPPIYSAIKQNGERLYKTARRGETVELPLRNVNIYRLELTSFKPPQITLEVECGKGTYIRSLAFDLGQVLGCEAHLKGLSRLANGPFQLEDAVTLTQLTKAVENGSWHSLVKPIDSALTELEVINLDAEQSLHFSNGETVQLSKAERSEEDGGNRYRVYNQDGRFIAIGAFKGDGGLLKPIKVFCNS